MDQGTEQKSSPPVWYMTMVAIPILIGTLWVARDFLIPLAITLLLFILSSALVDRIRGFHLFGWQIPGWLAQVLSAATIIGAIGLMGLVISNSADDVQDALPRYQERIASIGAQIEAFVPAQIITAVEEAVAEADIAAWISAAAGQFGGILSMLALVVLYLAFLMAERLNWERKIPRLASTEEGAQRTRKILTRISDGVKGYMWVNAVTSALSGVVAFIVFSWIGLDFAALLALNVFVMGFIPNIGAFIGIAMPAMVALIQFDTLTPFFVVLFVYGGADQVIANVLQPAMQGRALNLSTFMVMVSLTFWATLWGGIGAFLAVPMMVVTMVVCAEIPATRWIAILMSSNGDLSGSEGEAAEHEGSEFEEEVAQLRADLEENQK